MTLHSPDTLSIPFTKFYFLCIICFVTGPHLTSGSLHVHGNYWPTGWESRIIDLKQSLLFLNQLQSLATCKLLVSLGSCSAAYYPHINSSYSIYALYGSLLAHVRIYPLYTVQPSIPRGFPSLSCRGNFLSLVISLYHNHR